MQNAIWEQPITGLTLSPINGVYTRVKKSTVALVQCSSYNEDAVYSAVSKGVELLGGIHRFAAAGEKILLKPNVLVGTHPDRCVSTHPAVLKAVGRLFKKVTSNLSYGDSPGAGQSAVHLQKALLSEAAGEIGIETADFDRGQEREFGKSPASEKFIIANGVLEADGLISLSKLKTHHLTRMTGAVKNQFGCIPGTIKRSYHLKLPGVYDFSKMLVNLTLLLMPRLYIMDGIRAMEGNGPQGGDPVDMGVLLFSSDPVALDSVMCAAIDLDPLYVPTNPAGRRLGLGTYRMDEIDIVGDDIASVINGDFNVRRGPVKDLSFNGMMTFINNLVAERPVIDYGKCNTCGECIEACPADPKALDWKKGDRNRPPVYRYIRCFRCFCCQEICPEGAITVKRSVLRLP